MAILKKLTIAAALIAGTTSLAAAQGQPTGNESPMAGGAGGGATTGNGASGMMNPPGKQGSMPSPAAQSQQKDVSPASPAASSKQEK
jgi:hypothetical protein